MEYIALNTNRTAYTPMDIYKMGTLTIGELIDELSQYDESTPVMFCNDEGYTYGFISDSTVELYDCDEN